MRLTVPNNICAAVVDPSMRHREPILGRGCYWMPNIGSVQQQQSVNSAASQKSMDPSGNNMFSDSDAPMV